MKKLVLLSAAVLATLFFGCETEEPVNQEELNQSQLAAENEAAIEETFEAVDDIGFYGALLTPTNGRSAEDVEQKDTPLNCAVRTHDKANNTITIDFGDGCENKNGHFVSGKIIITYTDHILVPGAVQTLTFEDFYVDSVKVEGLRTRKNISEDLDDVLKFEITLKDGKLIWPDGSEATRDARWMVTRIRANNPLEDERHLDGAAEGQTRNEVDYSVTITETIVFKRGCRPVRLFIPVSGVKVLTLGERQRTIDYGDGTCDRWVAVTSNGETYRVRLRRLLGLHI